MNALETGRREWLMRLGRTRLVVLYWVVFVLFALAAATRAESGQRIPREVQEAVLNGQWETVVKLLETVNEKTPSPVLRLIKGHACLATNRNNESLSLFFSALNDEDHRAWREWTDGLASQTDKKRNAITWYLKGDARARQEQWVSAAECFDKAIEEDKNCFLAYNARGVVAHAVGSTLVARVYFQRAATIKEDFADAYASRGTLNVFQNSVEAVEVFREAKRHSRDENPVLAAIGLGCIHYGKQQYTEARDLFNSLEDVPAVERLVQHNQLAIATAKLRRDVRRALDAGMSIEAIENVVRDSGAFGHDFQQQMNPNAHFRSAPDWFWAFLIFGKVFIPYPLEELEPHLPHDRPVVEPEKKPDVGDGGKKKPDVGDGGKKKPDVGDGGKKKPDVGDGGKKKPDVGDGGKKKQKDGEDENKKKPQTVPLTPSARRIVLSSPDELRRLLDQPVSRGTGIVIGGNPGPGGWPPIFIDPIINRPPQPIDPIPPLPDIRVYTQALNAIAAHLNVAIPPTGQGTGTGRPATRPKSQEGGVNADVSRVRVNRGNWEVGTTYGLLYDVTAERRRNASAAEPK